MNVLMKITPAPGVNHPVTAAFSVFCSSWDSRSASSCHVRWAVIADWDPDDWCV